MPPIEEARDLRSRVAVLEDWRDEHRPWMEKISDKLDRVDETLKSLRLCSSPNSCLSLREEVAELAKENKNAMARIENLERWRTFISGAVAAIGCVWLLLQIVIPWVMKVAGGVAT